ncbi:MAG: cell division protein FtsZ [Schleiferiaceae bacterium]
MSDQQLDSEFSFDLPKNKSSVIKVIGVGGGGSNAVNHMKNTGIKGVDFIICNTDAQALYHSPVDVKIQLGVALTEGLGAGANPEVGQQAAVENIDEIKTILGTNTKMLFITAGMGGGTGTGAAPVIAKAARDLGVLTVGIVTIPFKFEGSTRQKQAEKGIDQLRSHVDSLIVINNNKLREVYGNLGFKAGFAKADEVLANAAKGIAEVITHHYTTNIDLKDARTVLANSGTAIMGSGKATGDDRAVKAIHDALDSPLLNDNQIVGAKNVLLLIVSGSEENEITFDEIGEITDFIQSEAGGDANIIMGIGEDNSLGQAIGITIVATGFNQDQQVKVINKEPEKVVHPLEEDQEVTRGIFEKPLALEEEEAPAKPARKAPVKPVPPTSEEPTDLFSQLAPEAPQSVEEPLPMEAEESAPAPTPIAEEEDRVVFSLEDEDIEWVMDEEDSSEEASNEIEEEVVEPISSEETPVEMSEDFSFDMVDLDAEESLEESLEESAAESFEERMEESVEESMDVTAEETPIEEAPAIELSDMDLSDVMTPEADPSLVDHSPVDQAPIDSAPQSEEEEEKVVFSLDDDFSVEEEEVSPTTDEPTLNTPSSPIEPTAPESNDVFDAPMGNAPVSSGTPNERTSNEPIKKYTLEDLEAFKQTLESKPQSSEPENAVDEDLSFEVKTVQPPVEQQAEEPTKGGVDPFDASIEESLKKKQDERKKRLEAFNYQFQSLQKSIKDAESEPAYKRQGIEVNHDAASKQSTMGNMSVSGENSDQIELRSNNSFLHDNVD